MANDKCRRCDNEPPIDERHAVCGLRVFSVDFEVFGEAVDVYFGQFAAVEAERLGLRGWCQRKEDGCIVGTLEGPEMAIEEMKLWLRTRGSPLSKIEKVEFGEMIKKRDFKYSAFNILNCEEKIIPPTESAIARRKQDND